MSVPAESLRTAAGALDSRNVDEMAALLAVAREGSFVGAGRSLQRHATIVSKRIGEQFAHGAPWRRVEGGPDP